MCVSDRFGSDSVMLRDSSAANASANATVIPVNPPVPVDVRSGFGPERFSELNLSKEPEMRGTCAETRANTHPASDDDEETP